MEREIILRDGAEAVRVLGVQDRYLKLVREHFGIDITARGHTIRLEGEESAVGGATELLNKIIDDSRNGGDAAERIVREAIEPVAFPPSSLPTKVDIPRVARTKGQERYLRAIADHDIVVSIGPAGTGKTFLAVRMAVESLKLGEVKKLILCRPAVEAGESLGFLPGDFHAKVNPYLRPLYDSLHNLLDYDQVRRYIDREIIEIVPLAYMRGRTLNDAFIILDEGQNTTPSQMKMFLTRMGERAKIVITGDITQVDLKPGQNSGLVNARRILKGIRGIAWVELGRTDIVRNPLVARIVDAYEAYEGEQDRAKKTRDKSPRSKTR